MNPSAISSSRARAGLRTGRSEPRGAGARAAFERALAAACQGQRGAVRAGGTTCVAPGGPGQAQRRRGAATGPGGDAPSGAAVGGAASGPLAIQDIEPAAALRAAVRALPPAIVATPLREGAQLSLSFGNLGVELRAGAQGLEVALQPSACLADAARAELPGLVAALRARGISVARAEVRPPSALQTPARPSSRRAR